MQPATDTPRAGKTRAEATSGDIRSSSADPDRATSGGSPAVSASPVTTSPSPAISPPPPTGQASLPTSAPGLVTKATPATPMGDLKPIGSTVIQGLGPVKILDRKIETAADGSEAQVLLVEHTEGKYPYLRVVQRGTAEKSTTEISVADHVLVQFAGGVAEAAIEQALLDRGLTIRKKFIQPGLYSVGVEQPGIDSTTDMLAALQALGAETVEIAEPDYLVFPN